MFMYTLDNCWQENVTVILKITFHLRGYFLTWITIINSVDPVETNTNQNQRVFPAASARVSQEFLHSLSDYIQHKC